MITRQKNDSSGTWIDHIPHKAEQEVLDVKAAYTNHNPEWGDITDHRPLWAVFRTQSSLNRAPSCKIPDRTHFDQYMRHLLMLEDFQNALQGYHARHPPPVETEDATLQQEYIFCTKRYSSKICERLCKKYEAQEQVSSIKNG